MQPLLLVVYMDLEENLRSEDILTAMISENMGKYHFSPLIHLF